MTAITRITTAAATALAAFGTAATADVDPSIPTYEETSDISGDLRSVGSDTLSNLMTQWGEAFYGMYPQVNFEAESKGSGTAPPALISGTAQLGPMSRRMKGEEVDKFTDAFGYEPTLVRTGIDAIAVFVAKDNPIEELTLDDLKNIFSVEGKDGITWGDVGVTDSRYADQPITLYGRNSASGTYGYFKSAGLGKADYKDSVNEQPGSSAVVQGVGGDQFGIGYSGIGYATPDVKAVPIVGADGIAYDPSNPDDVYSESYPLARFLYVYVNKNPNEDLEPLTAEFLTLVLSQQGQEVVDRDGFYTLSNFIVQQEREKLGLN
ncbi:MAG: phosphate ABC transporter substrate-binding protein [Planctomycetota bacterium]